MSRNKVNLQAQNVWKISKHFLIIHETKINKQLWVCYQNINRSKSGPRQLKLSFKDIHAYVRRKRTAIHLYVHLTGVGCLLAGVCT